jgi:ABC-type polysaccharide/polyol phosphate export permease
MPMFFLSGALFPLGGLPGWLQLLTRLDPITYAVDPMRRALFAHLPAGTALHAGMSMGVTWGGWLVPVWLELTLVSAGALVAMGLAVVQFSRPE